MAFMRRDTRPRDFHRGRYENPFNKRRKARATPPAPPLRRRLEVAGLVAIILAWVGLMAWHPFFNIRTVKVEGATRVPDTAVAAVVHKYLEQKKFFIFPQKNYFLTSASGIKTAIHNHYAFATIAAHFTFPHEVRIVVQEKVLRFLVGTIAGEWFSVDENGITFEKMVVPRGDILTTVALAPAHAPTTTVVQALASIHESFPNYQLIILAQNKTTGIGQQIIDENLAKKIITINERLRALNLTAKFFIKPHPDVAEIDAYVSEGWGIYLKTSEDVVPALNRLETLIKTKLKTRENLMYVDLRFGERVYFK